MADQKQDKLEHIKKLYPEADWKKIDGEFDELKGETKKAAAAFRSLGDYRGPISDNILSIIKAAIGQKVAHKGRIDPTWTNDHKNDDWFKFNVIQIGMVYNLALHFNTVDLVTDKQGVCWSVDFHQ